MNQPPSSAAPTPGPYWVDANGDDILIEAPDDVPICGVHNPDRTREENLANAYLLAASWETAVERDRLVVVNEGLVALLRKALPHVEGVANSLTIMTGPIVGPVDRLASEIQTALAKARKP